jgi:aspartyl-tRNA(Asn)/glutamyl-tRNA(Gln) amidotransferase subunit A
LSDDVCARSAVELGALLRARELSPVEVTLAFLERIERLNPDLLAFVHLDRAGALLAARAVDAEIGRREFRGPLHGVPVAYKDIIDVHGLPTTAGSQLLADHIALEDADVVARLREAGTICLGKLNTTEFASGDMAFHGEARNPWDTARTTGGSSSGPAGAVAARLTPLAVGTDTGGSVRVPAALCGVVGLRPSYGRISPKGIVPLSWSHDQAGPIARSTADAVLLLAGMIGASEYAAEPAGDVHGIRLGVPRDFFADNVDPDVSASVAAAIDTLRGLGATIVEVELPNAHLAYAAQWALAYTEAFLLHHAAFESSWRSYGDRFFHKIAGAGFLTSEELVIAHRLRNRIGADFREAFKRADAILTPTTGHPANRIDERYPGGDPARFTRPISLAGLPALSVPCGFTRDGLPIGLQLIAATWQESSLLTIGHAYGQATSADAREPSFQRGRATPSTEFASATAVEHALSADWILDAARLLGFDFVTEAHAAAIGASIGPIKHALAHARAPMAGEPQVPAC